jgi:hypothetical protein
MVVSRVAAALGTLAAAVWLGGLLALGAFVAPAVFSRVPLPWSADAMTVVFRRFDLVAMACAAVLLACEAARVAVRVRFTRADQARTLLLLLAAAAAVYEGSKVSPRIAELHAAGAVRGVGPAGAALSALHDTAELLGKAQLGLLVIAVVLFAIRPDSAHHPS